MQRVFEFVLWSSDYMTVAGFTASAAMICFIVWDKYRKKRRAKPAAPAQKTWYERYAEKAGVQVNPDLVMRELVLQGLEKNKAETGRRYCPCVPSYAWTQDTICPCEEMRMNKCCHCQLFVQIGGKA